MRLPEKKRPGQPVLASDWNLLLDAIAARTPRPSPGLELVQGSGGFAYRLRPTAGDEGGAAAPHPFQILGSLDGSGNPRVSINYGQITGWSLHANAAGTSPMLQAVHVDFLVGGSYAANHPTLTTVGYIGLTANTPYGVWLRASQATGTRVDLDGGGGRGWDKLYTAVATDWQVVVDSTDTGQTDKASDTDYVWYYLGRVSYDKPGAEPGTFAVLQYQRTDLNVPFGTMPAITPSLDEGNSLSTSPTDGLLFVPPIVSADAGNDLGLGSDGGVYYEEPTIVSGDPGNDISPGSDGGAFYQDPGP